MVPPLEGAPVPGKGRKRANPTKDRSLSPTPSRKRRKLLEGERVEVRFTEDGLKGSWHPGVVVRCEDCVRHVEYREILADDNTSKLVEAIPVPKAVEGLANKVPNARDHRGSVRPEPPYRKVEQSSVGYGACIDAQVDDAWWEGVVFDREDGKPERLVLFPDQGDCQLISVDQMRHTLDWNEVSGDWKPRGHWIMLRVLEKLEKEEPFPISIREIWYDVSISDAYHSKIGQWTSGSWFTWRSLVTNVIKEALAVAQDGTGAEVVPFTRSPSECLGGTTFLGDLPIQSDVPQLPTASGSELATSPRDGDCSTSGLVGSPHHRNGTELCTIAEDSLSSDTSDVVMHRLSEQAKDEHILKEFSNSAILDFVTEKRNHSGRRSADERKRLKELHDTAMSELLSSGWTIKELECGVKMYVSSEGLRSQSFIKACELWVKDIELKASKDTGTQETLAVHQSSERNKIENGVSEACSTGKEMKNWELESIKGEYSPFAIMNYTKFLRGGGKSVSEQPGQSGFYYQAAKKTAKKHLVALGWSIYQKKTEFAGCVIPKHRYVTPQGAKFSTLDKAVMYLLSTGQYATGEEEGVSDITPGPTGVSCQESTLTEARTSRTVDFAPENCPGAIEEYVEYMELSKNGAVTSADMKHIRSNAKKHLLYLGWKAWFTNKYDREEIRYTSPDQRVFASLVTACKYCLKEKGSTKGIPSKNGTKKLETFICLSDNDSLKFRVRSVPSTKSGNAENAFGRESGKCSTSSHEVMQCKKLSIITSSKRNKSLSSRRKICLVSSSDDVLDSPSSSSKKSRKRKMSCTTATNKSGSSSAVPRTTLQTRSGGQVPESHQHAPKTIISWIIDNSVVLPRQKVRYLRKRDGYVMKEGQITREGIRCKCCKEVFTLSQFERHAGSKNHRPSANIFLCDGRSILDCQRQALNSKGSKKSIDKHMESCNSDKFPHKRIKSDLSHYPSDGVCSICQDGGDLILCDYCPSSYHLSCIGLQDVPEGKWFCPPCRCGICGSGEFNSDSMQFTNETKLFCDQCEREYHVGCLEKHGTDAITSCPEGYWFCSQTCSKISSQLHQILGVSNPAAVEGYSWTILKSSNDDFDNEAFSKETRTEHQSKLCVALDVLHECFIPMVEPRNNRDIVADLLFNKESELNRLNFWGFYTLLLEKNDELITVANIRIFGNKVAEMPLIGTRIKYRRKGMCRLLINELEKLLCSLGVEKLLLPAIPDLLQTWKTKFGFTEMADSDKLLLADYTFLSFQGTVMCQKSLKSSTTIFGDVGEVIKRIGCGGGGGESCGIITDTSRKSNYSNDIIIPEVEMVPALTVSPPSTCLLPSKGVVVGEGDTLSNKVLDSPIISAEGATPLQVGEERNFENKLAKEVTMSVASGKLEDNSATMPTTILMTKAATASNCHRLKQHNEQTASTKSGSQWCLIGALNAKNTNTYKYCYKRRVC